MGKMSFGIKLGIGYHLHLLEVTSHTHDIQYTHTHGPCVIYSDFLCFFRSFIIVYYIHLDLINHIIRFKASSHHDFRMSQQDTCVPNCYS